MDGDTPSIPDYGSMTVMRPLVENVPYAPPGAVLTHCDWCGRPCWKLQFENTLPHPPYVGACTNCALKRAKRQREMDAERFRREARP